MANKLQSRLVVGSPAIPREYRKAIDKLPYHEFAENASLAIMVSSYLQIEKSTILHGIANVRPDPGVLQAWKLARGNKNWIAINAFAANDPESTKTIIELVLSRLSHSKEKLVGIFNLREDRGDRTLQWIEAIANEGFNIFHRLLVFGSHPHNSALARILLRYCGHLYRSKQTDPEVIMEHIYALEKDGAIVIGLGNYHGLGSKLVCYWKSIGTHYEL
jgi:poly-gamma-glutamate synthase PgsB/CapB